MDRRDQDMAPTTSTQAAAVIERAFVRGDGVAAARLCRVDQLQERMGRWLRICARGGAGMHPDLFEPGRCRYAP